MASRFGPEARKRAAAKSARVRAKGKPKGRGKLKGDRNLIVKIIWGGK